MFREFPELPFFSCVKEQRKEHIKFCFQSYSFSYNIGEDGTVCDWKDLRIMCGWPAYSALCCVLYVVQFLEILKLN